MNIQSLKNLAFPLIFLMVFFTSCSGQTKNNQTNDTLVDKLSLASKNAKLSKTQRSNEFQDISCGLQDKAGNLWIGTSAEGVYRYDGKLFTQFTKQDGLSDNSVHAMLEDKKGNIWIGTNKGLCCYDGKTIKQISIVLNSIFQYDYSDNANSSIKNEVFSIIQDKNELLWLGTSDGVVCYDGQNFTRFLDNHTIINDSSLTLKSVQCMFEDTKGNIWFGSGPMAFEGLCLYNGKSLTKFKPKSQGWIRKINKNINGTILFTTRAAGVLMYDGTNFITTPKPTEFHNDLLNDFLVDHKGNSWYASDYVNDNDITTGGLWKYDGKSFVEFTKKDGLSNTSVTVILEDRNGYIWSGTRNTGLYRYDGKTFISFSE